MPQSTATASMSGVEKAAILLISLGTEIASEVFKHLAPEEIELLARQIVRTKSIEPEVKQTVLEEFEQICEAGGLGGASGGADYARQVLQQALGPARGLEMIDWIMGGRSRPFEWIKERDPHQIFELIQNEHPQTIALILSNLPPQKAAVVLGNLSPELQSEVAFRVVTMDATTAEVATQIEDVLRDKFCSVGSTQCAATGGSQALAEMLNSASRSAEKSILEGIAKQDPGLADEIKQLMFVFDDIVRLDDRSIQLIIREVDQDDLRLALKGVGDNVKEAIFRNMSERAAETLKEDLELGGPVKVRDVEAAQQKIMGVLRDLEEKGDLVLRRTSEDALIE